MPTQASEAFGLFLTALRNAGVEIPLSDAEVATLLADALDVIDPDGAYEALTSDTLGIEIRGLAEANLLATDNGWPVVDEDIADV